jgi:hypothetical protein
MDQSKSLNLLILIQMNNTVCGWMCSIMLIAFVDDIMFTRVVPMRILYSLDSFQFHFNSSPFYRYCISRYEK